LVLRAALFLDWLLVINPWGVAGLWVYWRKPYASSTAAGMRKELLACRKLHLLWMPTAIDEKVVHRDLKKTFE
jgi:hypothetical protein